MRKSEDSNDIPEDEKDYDTSGFKLVHTVSRNNKKAVVTQAPGHHSVTKKTIATKSDRKVAEDFKNAFKVARPVPVAV